MILDYGHNPAAVQAMVQLCDALQPDGKRVLVLAAPGDRRDEDILDIATHCAGHFDHYICRRDDNTRGRGDAEVPTLQRQALIDAGVDSKLIEIIPKESDAVNRALELGEPGDLLLIFGDAIERCWEQITGFQSEGGEEQPAASPVPALPRQLLTDSALGVGEELVRDERGVRLARRQEPSD